MHTRALRNVASGPVPLNRSLRIDVPSRSAAADQDQAKSLQALKRRMLAGTNLSGALAFMDAVGRGWEPRETLAWLHEHLVAPGWMKPPRALREPGVGTIELSGIDARRDEVAELTATARRRVALSLLDFVAPNPEGAFLRAALYSARVHRTLVGGRPGWAPAPRETDFLSEMVLSLFASEILADSDLYRRHMTVCAGCVRIAFAEAGQLRSCPRCNGELPAADTDRTPRGDPRRSR